MKTKVTYADSGETVELSGFRVEMQRAGHLDGGIYHKPKWVLRYWAGDSPRCRPINCGGDRKPLGKDLEDTCKGLGLTTEQIYSIPVHDQ